MNMFAKTNADAEFVIREEGEDLGRGKIAWNEFTQFVLSRDEWNDVKSRLSLKELERDVKKEELMQDKEGLFCIRIWAKDAIADLLREIIEEMK